MMNTIWLTRARIEHAQIVVNLCHGGDRRARIVGTAFLVYRNRRREAGYLINIRLRHLIEELPRVCRKGFNISSLPFCKNRVKGERGLTRAREASNHRHSASRHRDRNIFQIMSSRTSHREPIAPVPVFIAPLTSTKSDLVLVVLMLFRCVGPRRSHMGCMLFHRNFLPVAGQVRCEYSVEIEKGHPTGCPFRFTMSNGGHPCVYKSSIQRVSLSSP